MPIQCAVMDVTCPCIPRLYPGHLHGCHFLVVVVLTMRVHNPLYHHPLSTSHIKHRHLLYFSKHFHPQNVHRLQLRHIDTSSLHDGRFFPFSGQVPFPNLSYPSLFDNNQHHNLSYLQPLLEHDSINLIMVSKHLIHHVPIQKTQRRLVLPSWHHSVQMMKTSWW